MCKQTEVYVLFTRGYLLRKTSVSLVLLVFRRPTFSRKPSDPLTFLRYQLTTGQMQFMLTQKQCHKSTVNQQVFHHVYSLFIQPTFRCFLNSALFYSALTGHTYTYTRICWKYGADFHASLNSFRYKTHHQHTHIHAYTLCFCRPPVAIRLSTALLGVTLSPCDAWCSQPPPSSPPKPLPPPGAACQSVSVISDSMLD